MVFNATFNNISVYGPVLHSFAVSMYIVYVLKCNLTRGPMQCRLNTWARWAVFVRVITVVNTCSIPMTTLIVFVRVITVVNTCSIPMTTLTVFVRVITVVNTCSIPMTTLTVFTIVCQYNI
jgi:hypothetical protein